MTPVVELIRLEDNYDYGTFGVLKINKKVFCVTLEPPDFENRQNVSSIPAQQYTCNRVDSPGFGNTFEVSNVPGRTNILFHAGNIKQNTKGCIILAEHYGKLQVEDAEERAVLNSGKTFQSFLEQMKDFDSFHLTVREVF